MSPLHSQTSVPQHGPQRWWVRKGSHDTRQNQFKTQHCGPGPGTIVPRARWSRIPGCSFAVPRRPVNATEPRRRCHGRVVRHRPADPVWALQLNEGEGSTGQSKNTQRDTTKHVLTHPSLDRKATISQTTFQMNSREWRVSYFDLIFTDVYS